MNSPTAWALVFHILGVVLWMAGLLMVTQVLAMYTQEGSLEVRQVLARLKKAAERSGHIGAALTIIAGIVLIVIQPAYLRQAWLHAKLFLVAILIGLDVVVDLRARAFQAGKIQLRRGECMAFHGCTALVFIGILVLVLIKPFGG